MKCFICGKSVKDEDLAFAANGGESVPIHKEHDKTNGSLRKQWLALEKEKMLNCSVPGVEPEVLKEYIERTFPTK